MEKSVRLILIILIVAMILVAVAGGVLYFTTDLLKSNNILFQKYLAQNINNFANVLDVSNEEKLIDFLRKNDYTEKSNIELSFLENEIDQEEIYNIVEEGITNNSEKESYKNIKISYTSEDLANIELLKKNNTYGFRLADLVEQFVSVENASVAYFVSSLGYDGKYFNERMNLEDFDFSGLFDFSDEEVKTMQEKYFKDIFSEIDKKSYTSKRNVLITLNNGESVTTKQYTLTLSKTDVDKIFKKILNQAIQDKIILDKLNHLDIEIEEAGFNEPKSLVKMYTSKLQSIYDSIEYLGQNETKILFNVYQQKGVTVRTSIKTDSGEYIIDLNNKNGTELSYKTIKLTEQGEDTKVYSLGKAEGDSRSFSYKDNTQNLTINVNTENLQNNISINGNIVYKNEKINKLEVNLKTDYDFSNKKQIETNFQENNNIILNNYEGDMINNIMTQLKNMEVNKLEEKRAKVNAKLLNNILLWVNAQEEKRIEEENNNLELKKQRFNNKFLLYEGEELDDETVQKMIKNVSQNMADYQVVNGKQIKILIEQGSKNEAKAEELVKAITNKYKYNIKMEYNEEGYISAINVSIFEKE